MGLIKEDQGHRCWFKSHDVVNFGKTITRGFLHAYSVGMSAGREFEIKICGPKNMGIVLSCADTR